MENNQGNIIIYQSEDGHTRIEVKMEKDTVWLSLNQMSILFDRDKSVISRQRERTKRQLNSWIQTTYQKKHIMVF